MRKQSLIPSSSAKKFILESIECILKNNNFLFDSIMFNQVFGTTIGTKCALPYACLTICYQKEIKLFTQELPKNFSNEDCLIIKEFFKRYMDDGFIF